MRKHIIFSIIYLTLLAIVYFGTKKYYDEIANVRVTTNIVTNIIVEKKEKEKISIVFHNIFSDKHDYWLNGFIDGYASTRINPSNIAIDYLSNYNNFANTIFKDDYTNYDCSDLLVHLSNTADNTIKMLKSNIRGVK